MIFQKCKIFQISLENKQNSGQAYFPSICQRNIRNCIISIHKTKLYANFQLKINSTCLKLLYTRNNLKICWWYLHEAAITGETSD